MDLQVKEMVAAVDGLLGAVEAQVKGDQQGVDQYCERVVAAEKKADRIRDAVVEKMFGRGRLPFSKSDRLHLVNRVDRVTDMAEIVARRLSFAPLQLPEDIKGDFIKLAGAAVETVRKLAVALGAIHDDLLEAKRLCKDVEDIRRVARNTEWSLFHRLYKSSLPVQRFVLLKDLIEGFGRLADRAEDFGDFLMALAAKYVSIR